MRIKELIVETTKPLRKSVKQSLPNLTSSSQLDNNNAPYLAYRFGVALAPSPDTESINDRGPIGSDFSMIDYTDADEKIRMAAAKKMGIKFDRGTGRGSEELDSHLINKVSPVAKPRRNRHGV